MSSEMDSVIQQELNMLEGMMQIHMDEIAYNLDELANSLQSALDTWQQVVDIVGPDVAMPDALSNLAEMMSRTDTDSVH